MFKPLHIQNKHVFFFINHTYLPRLFPRRREPGIRYSTNIAWQLMTIITKVGASYVDHMNDDVPEVDSFSYECYQALSSPCFWGESLGTMLLIRVTPNPIIIDIPQGMHVADRQTGRQLCQRTSKLPQHLAQGRNESWWTQLAFVKHCPLLLNNWKINKTWHHNQLTPTVLLYKYALKVQGGIPY